MAVDEFPETTITAAHLGLLKMACQESLCTHGADERQPAGNSLACSGPPDLIMCCPNLPQVFMYMYIHVLVHVTCAWHVHVHVHVQYM